MLPATGPAVLAIAETRCHDLAAALARANKGRRAIEGAVWLDQARAQDLYLSANGVAVVAVRGVLLDSLPFHGSDWATGYNGIRMAVAAALEDSSVKAIVLDIDSGGGMVAGCFELCAWLRAAGEVKPLVAIVSNWAASAAYAIASSCGSISAPLTGAVGSIGVIRMHIDISKMLESAGVAVTLIKAGARKTDGNPYEPLPAAVEEGWTATMEAYRTMFARHVSAGRGIGLDAVLETEARLYEGPIDIPRAADLGLIDAVAPPDEAFAAVVNHAAGMD